MDVGTDDAEAAGDGGGAAAQVDLAGDVVEVDPLAVAGIDNALGSQHWVETAKIADFEI